MTDHSESHASHLRCVLVENSSDDVTADLRHVSFTSSIMCRHVHIILFTRPLLVLLPESHTHHACLRLTSRIKGLHINMAQEKKNSNQLLIIAGNCQILDSLF